MMAVHASSWPEQIPAGELEGERPAPLEQDDEAHAYGFGGIASTFARFRRRRAASACFFRRLTLGFI